MPVYSSRLVSAFSSSASITSTTPCQLRSTSSASSSSSGAFRPVDAADDFSSRLVSRSSRSALSSSCDATSGLTVR